MVRWVGATILDKFEEAINLMEQCVERKTKAERPEVLTRMWKFDLVYEKGG